ncbi:MAG: lysylphosphatidylglycerol synthase transmembrane domain-containing protein [Anaerolineae bacterium]
MRAQVTNLFKVFISLALIVIVFSRVDLAAVGAQLTRANPAPVAAALLFYLLAIAANAAKWLVLLRAQGVRVPFGELLQMQFVGFFFNNFLPANVGGDVMRGYTLARYTDRLAHAAVSVVVDRIVGLLAYMSSAAVAAFVLVSVVGRRDLEAVEGVAALALAVLAVGFGVLLSRRLRALISRLFGWRFLKPLGRPWQGISDGLNAYRFRYDVLAAAFGIGLIGILCTTIVNWYLSQALGGLMALPTILLFNPLIALVLMLPISIGGLGLNQAAYPFFYGLGGVPADHAVAVSVLMQAIIVVGSLPGGFFWLRNKERRHD